MKPVNPPKYSWHADNPISNSYRACLAHSIPQDRNYPPEVSSLLFTAPKIQKANFQHHNTRAWGVIPSPPTCSKLCEVPPLPGLTQQAATPPLAMACSVPKEQGDPLKRVGKLCNVQLIFFKWLPSDAASPLQHGLTLQQQQSSTFSQFSVASITSFPARLHRKH